MKNPAMKGIVGTMSYRIARIRTRYCAILIHWFRVRVPEGAPPVSLIDWEERDGRCTRCPVRRACLVFDLDTALAGSAKLGQIISCTVTRSDHGDR